MSSASDVAAGFSISGLLDAGAKTRSKYPVAELDINAIEDNPENARRSGCWRRKTPPIGRWAAASSKA